MSGGAPLPSTNVLVGDGVALTIVRQVQIIEIAISLPAAALVIYTIDPIAGSGTCSTERESVPTGAGRDSVGV
jgi:hypothetical protein